MTTPTLDKRKCPVCLGPLELVHQGVGCWRVSCMANDVIEDDLPTPCAFKDVYGQDAAQAVANFDATPQGESK